jgi:hypothetical protein
MLLSLFAGVALALGAEPGAVVGTVLSRALALIAGFSCCISWEVCPYNTFLIQLPRPGRTTR